MIVGLGTDIVNIERINKAYQRFGKKFITKVLADKEQEVISALDNPARLLAKRFAAKEACAKALGSGFRNGLSLKDIWVSHDELGKPLINFSGKAQRIITNLGVTRSHLSLSDEREHAIATVILEKDHD